MIAPFKFSPTVLIVFVAALIGYGLGHALGSASGEAEAAAIRDEVRRGMVAHAQHINTQLIEAAQHSDTLTRQLYIAQRHAAKLNRERADALNKTTTGDVCLREPALRVLHGADGVRVDGLPDTDAGSGTAADDARIASDTDVAGWIVSAGGQYEECRRRLDALIAWHREAR